MDKLKIGYAICGSFCTFDRSIAVMEGLLSKGFEITPIMSFNACSINTRFGKAADFVDKIEGICNKKIINTISAAEPIGPKKMFDALVVCPCTGNTLAKLCYGVTDTPVTMAVKSHVRNERPAIIAVSTNDALSCNAVNIGTLLNRKSYFFVPMGQDDPIKKPRSIVAHMEKTYETIIAALEFRQIQPIFQDYTLHC